MSNGAAHPTITEAGRLSERLNRECFCITLDEAALCEALRREVGDPAFCDLFIKTRPNLFARAPVFVPESDIVAMHRVVLAIEGAVRLPGYEAAALSWAPEIARHDLGPVGAFMGYDFHMSSDGPKLIEINTNAGGAFLNAALGRAQRACCPEVQVALARPEVDEFDRSVVRMFLAEWTRQRKQGQPRRIAIVDDQPQEQYLYPEFVLAQRLLQRHGIETVITDAADLHYEQNRLLAEDKAIDLVYNRLVDFDFGDPRHAAVRAAYLDGAAVVTPAPRNHALFADKRNLTLLSDQSSLLSWGVTPEKLADLSAVPHTFLVTPGNAPRLWEGRRKLFFKPARGHGSKAVYRGDKITKAVWAEIIRGGYVAQKLTPPSERVVKVDDAHEVRKTDFRLYVYDGEILLVAARLYQGQTTNFRTPGGGFAPVFVV